MMETLQVKKEETKEPNDTTNRLFPVFLKLETLHVLVVGAGKVGLEKLNAL
ncbi:MAG TPA: NAD(P)-dependent oxidoreductase, partial [Flavisolibacter sp.]|nr:NAD(P)-dependent oxidoreductase [Flavisolibacter sp.]